MYLAENLSFNSIIPFFFVLNKKILFFFMLKSSTAPLKGNDLLSCSIKQHMQRSGHYNGAVDVKCLTKRFESGVDLPAKSKFFLYLFFIFSMMTL